MRYKDTEKNDVAFDGGIFELETDRGFLVYRTSNFQFWGVDKLELERINVRNERENIC